MLFVENNIFPFFASAINQFCLLRKSFLALGNKWCDFREEE